jgi:hypothetical protein
MEQRVNVTFCLFPWKIAVETHGMFEAVQGIEAVCTLRMV